MVDTLQPQGLAGFRNRSASSLLMKMQLLTWNNAKPTPGPDTRPASSMVVGAGCRGENPRLRRREKNVLDFPFYRPGVYTHDPWLLVKWRFFANNRYGLVRRKLQLLKF